MVDNLYSFLLFFLIPTLSLGGAGVGQVGPDHLDPQVLLHLFPY